VSFPGFREERNYSIREDQGKIKRGYQVTGGLTKRVGGAQREELYKGDRRGGRKSKGNSCLEYIPSSI